MRLLGLETSCDETSVALVKARDERTFIVEKNLIASQAAKHAEYGGVVPEVAARVHVDVIFPLLEAAGVPHDGAGIDAIAVTVGPGLVPALRIGVEAAKTLAWAWRKPLVAVNHLEGHLASIFFSSPKGAPIQVALEFPAVCLLVSGGHTELLFMKNFCEYEFLGRTRDDAAGEAFDKVAGLLGLPYPGGPEVSKMALQGRREAIDFPRPMLGSGDFDFSFAGLKTAVAVYLKTHSVKDDQELNDLCASFEQAVVDVLVEKTRRAVEATGVGAVIVSGGVSANLLLREEMRNRLSPLPVFFPFSEYTGDNAAMIAAAGAWRARRGEFVNPLKLEAEPNTRLV